MRTNDEKARAYDEALIKVKELLDSPRTCFDIVQLKDVFPELREIEDERIRKSLIGLVEQFMTDEQKEKTLAWLEKQKELKKEQKPSKWSKKDKKILQSLHHVMNCADAQNAVKRDGLSVEDVCNFLFSIEPNWKPSEEQVEGWVAVDSNTEGKRRVTFFPQKPVRDVLTEYKYWAATRPSYESIKLDSNAFPDLKWEDEPKKVRIVIVKV